MSRFALVALAALPLTLAGCGPDIDELRARPVLFTATAPVAFETLANCLAGRWSGHFMVTPQIYRPQGVAYVTLSAPGVQGVFAEYQIKRTGEDSSAIEFRRRKVIADLGDFEGEARTNIALCSKP